MNTKRLAITCLYFSSKITGASIDNDSFTTFVKNGFDVDLELKICNLLDFSFDFLDIYFLVKKICKTIHKEHSLEPRIVILDTIFASDKINKISILSDSPEAPYLAFQLFTEEEISLFETIECIEIDRKLLEKTRNFFV